MKQAAEYVLGTGLDELDRLGLQHRLWSDAAHAAWKTARVTMGKRVLDVGAGPGHAAFDLAQMVTRHGAVLAVDESPSFIAHLEQQAIVRGLPQLRGVVGDVQKLGGLPEVSSASFDVAYARWVLCFVADPAAVVSGVAAALRPGGRFVVHDYFNYTTMTSAPRRPAITRVVEATAASWIARGGNPDIGGVLPRLMEAAGLRVESVQVHQRLARGSDAMFQWPDLWWRIYTPKLVSMGYVTQADCDQVLADLDDLARSTSDYWVCPPVFEIIGVKS
jgi:ubiquinone/menaquinone biosynthesis C-methylase UbiE